MARRLSFEEANEAKRSVLFDMNVLKAAFEASDDYGRRVRSLLSRVPTDRRFTLELVVWEFLHPNVHRDVMAQRKKWLNEQQLRVHTGGSRAYVQSFLSLAANHQARGSPVDGALAACSIGSKGRFVIATADEDGFCWNAAIVVIADFFRNPDACR